MVRAARTAQVAGSVLLGAIAVIVAWEGSPGWRLARLAVAVLLAVVWWRAPRLPRAVLGTMAALAAALGIAVGVGIGVRHLTEGDVAPDGIAGLVALAAGVVLLVVSGQLLFAGRGWALRVVGGLALVVLMGLALLTLGQALVATNVPETSVGDASPADVGLDYEAVTATTADGIELAGWYVPSENGAAVVLRHGAGSTRADELDHAAVLARNGYGVLLMDARGHGDSDGRAMDFGWHGDADIVAGVDLLVARPELDPDRVAVIGMSMGGEEALGALAADPRLRAAVAEGVGQRVAADKGWLSEEYGARGWLQEQIERATFGLTALLTDVDPPIALRDAVTAASPRPVLLIAGEEVPDEPKTARVLAAAAPDSVEVWVVPGADHTGGLRTAPDEWEQRVVDFLDAALR